MTRLQQPRYRFLPLLLGVAGIFCVLPGCEPSCEKLAEGEQSFEVGTGEQSFKSISEGEDLTLTFGNQGGQHIWGAVRTEGLHRGPPDGFPDDGNERPELSIELRSGDIVLASSGAMYPEPLNHLPGQVGKTHGLFVFIEFSPYAAPGLFPPDYDPEVFIDPETEEAAWNYAYEQVGLLDWEFIATIRDSCGTELTDSKAVTVNYYADILEELEEEPE